MSSSSRDCRSYLEPSRASPNVLDDSVPRDEEPRQYTPVPHPGCDPYSNCPPSGQGVPQPDSIHHLRECHLMHQECSVTGQMKEAQRTRESPSKFPDIDREESSEVRNFQPDSEADGGVEDSDTQSDTLRMKRSGAGSHPRTVLTTAGFSLRPFMVAQVFQHGEGGGIVDPHCGSIHTERNRRESDASLPQALLGQENAELQNDSPHSEGSKSELMVLPLGEAGAQQRDPARGGYSLKIEGDVLESRVFRKEVGEEREDADPQSSSREGNESNLKVQTGDTVTEREDTDLQSHPFDSERKGSEPNVCVIHDTTDLPPVEPHVSVSDSSVRELGDNPSLVPPGTKLRPRRSGITPKSSRFFQVLKSPRGTQEKERASPVIVQAAKFNNPLAVAPGESNKQARNGNKKGRCHRMRSVDGEHGYSNGYRGRRGSMDPSLYATTLSSAADARSEHTSDCEHSRACCVVCGFRLL